MEVLLRRMGALSVLFLCLSTIGYGQPAATGPARAEKPDRATLPPEEGGLGNKLFATPNDVHALFIEDPVSFADTRPGLLTSRVIETDFPFNDLLPSWNVDVPPGGAFTVAIRVGRREGDFWTPYYFLGTWGRREPLKGKHLRDENGFINIDYFQSSKKFDRIQYRFHLEQGEGGQWPVPRRVALAYSNTLNDADLARKFRKPVDPGPKEKWARRLPIPFRSQRWEDAKIRGMICSPTSVSMVLEYRGVKRPTVEVCNTIYDPAYRMYGNWWRAVQGAYTYGIPGRIERFGDWNAVKRHIAAGQPIIASIRIKKGEMSHAPNRESDGHLMIIAGFDENGDVLVNDPAAQTVEQGVTTYKRADMDKVWLARGGVGYILLPAKRAEKSAE